MPWRARTVATAVGSTLLAGCAAAIGLSCRALLWRSSGPIGGCPSLSVRVGGCASGPIGIGGCPSRPIRVGSCASGPIGGCPSLSVRVGSCASRPVRGGCPTRTARRSILSSICRVGCIGIARSWRVSCTIVWAMFLVLSTRLCCTRATALTMRS